MAGGVGTPRHQPVDRIRPPPCQGSLLQPDDVPLSVRGRAAHRQPLRLHRGGRQRPFLAAHGQGRLRTHGLRCVRHSLGKLRVEGRQESQRPDSRQHRQFHTRAEALRRHVRLEPHGELHQRRLLPVDAMGIPEALQRRPRRTPPGPGQLVSVLHDRARQRAGDPRALRALRQPGRAARTAAVVLQDHRLRLAPARQSRDDRLVRQHQEGASQLDRAQRGCRSGLRRLARESAIRVFTTRPDTLFGATYMVSPRSMRSWTS